MAALTEGANTALAAILNGAFVSNLTGMTLNSITDIITLPVPIAPNAGAALVRGAAGNITHLSNALRVELVALMVMCAFSNRSAVKNHCDQAIRANADLLALLQSTFWIQNDINFSALVSGGFLSVAAGAFDQTDVVNAIIVKYGSVNIYNFNLLSVSSTRQNILRQWMTRHSQQTFNQCVGRLNGTVEDQGNFVTL
jgi:hypothetical protein